MGSYNWEEVKVITSAVALIILIAALHEKSKDSPVTLKGRYYNCFELGTS